MRKLKILILSCFCLIGLTGRIHNVTQDVSQLNQYLLFGEEKKNDMTRFVLIQLKMN